MTEYSPKPTEKIQTVLIRIKDNSLKEESDIKGFLRDVKTLDDRGVVKDTPIGKYLEFLGQKKQVTDSLKVFMLNVVRKPIEQQDALNLGDIQDSLRVARVLGMDKSPENSEFLKIVEEAEKEFTPVETAPTEEVQIEPTIEVGETVQELPALPELQEQAIGEQTDLPEVKTGIKPVQLGDDTWISDEADIPVKVVKSLGFLNDREYVQIEGSTTGIPRDQLESWKKDQIPPAVSAGKVEFEQASQPEVLPKKEPGWGTELPDPFAGLDFDALVKTLNTPPEASTRTEPVNPPVSEYRPVNVSPGVHELVPIQGVNVIDQAKEYLANSRRAQEILAGDPSRFIGYLKTIPPFKFSFAGMDFVGSMGDIVAVPVGNTIKTKGTFNANSNKIPFEAELTIDQEGKIVVRKKNYSLPWQYKAMAPVVNGQIEGINAKLTSRIEENIGQDWKVARYGIGNNKMSITFKRR